MLLFSYSVFNGEPIPYPKRECIADEDNKDDKNDAAGKDQVHIVIIILLCDYFYFVEEWAKGTFWEEGQTQL